MKKTVTIGLPLPDVGEYSCDVSWPTRQALNDLEAFSARHGITTIEAPHKSVNVTKNHIECANSMRGEWLLICGSDHSFAPDSLLNLLNAAYGLEYNAAYKEEDIPKEPQRMIIGAITPFRMPPFRWVAMNWDRYKQNLYPIVPGVDFLPIQTLGGHVIPVDAVGSGFCLYHRSVFETVPYPWFYNATRNGVMFGPDVRLCIDAQELGIQTWLHLGVTALHYTFAPVGFQHYIEYLREAPEAFWADANKGAIMTEESIQELKQKYAWETVCKDPGEVDDAKGLRKNEGQIHPGGDDAGEGETEGGANLQRDAQEEPSHTEGRVE